MIFEFWRWVGNKKNADSKTLINDETKCFFASTFSSHLKMQCNEKCQRTEENKQKSIVCVRASFFLSSSCRSENKNFRCIYSESIEQIHLDSSQIATNIIWFNSPRFIARFV